MHRGQRGRAGLGRCFSAVLVHYSGGEPESLMSHFLFSAHSNIADAIWELCWRLWPWQRRQAAPALAPGVAGQNLAVRHGYTWSLLLYQLVHFLPRDS